MLARRQPSLNSSQGHKLWYHMKGFVTRNTHVQYESYISSGLKVTAKVKVFVHASHADTDADAKADISPPDIFIPTRY